MEMSWEVKAIVLAVCFALGILLITFDKLFKGRRRSPKLDKTK